MTSTRQQFPLSIKKVLKKTLVGIFGWLIFLVAVLGVTIAFFLGGSGGENYVVLIVVGSISFFLIVSLITYFYQYWYYQTYLYDLTPDYVIIKKGPITPHEITIPYERIQDVYVDQDILDRLLGLYDVHLSSATVSSGMAAHIDGVEKPASDGLRALLLKTVSEKISRNRAPAPQSA